MRSSRIATRIQKQHKISRSTLARRIETLPPNSLDVEASRCFFDVENK